MIKPILFNTAMVRAILDGRKTVTRRVVKPQPACRIAYIMAGHRAGTWGYPAESVHKYWGDDYRVPLGLSQDERERRWKPPYHGDDLLWVRETWFQLKAGGFAYKADANGKSEKLRVEFGYKWRPSIHMPREAARIWLRVAALRVEMLQEIDLAGVYAEGVNGRFGATRGAFINLWNSTIKPADGELYGWAANPWVWVNEFERCEKPEGFDG